MIVVVVVVVAIVVIIIINLLFYNRRTGFLVFAQNIFVVVADSFGVPAK
jgi:hypothetical protein